MIKVATYNIKNKTANKLLGSKKSLLKRFNQNIELIKQADPDIIGLQEVTKEEYQRLKEIFCGKYELYGDFRGSKGITNEACPILVKTNKGFVKDYGTFSISDDINDIGRKYFGAFFPRITTYVHYVDDYDEYCVMNIHVDNSRYIQNKTFKENGPIEKSLKLCHLKNQIVLGDMNMPIENELKKFCDRNIFSDAAEKLGNTYRPLNLALDHILYDDIEMDAFDTSEFINDGSDHSLIMTIIKPKRR